MSLIAQSFLFPSFFIFGYSKMKRKVPKYICKYKINFFICIGLICRFMRAQIKLLLKDFKRSFSPSFQNAVTSLFLEINEQLYWVLFYYMPYNTNPLCIAILNFTHGRGRCYNYVLRPSIPNICYSTVTCKILH